MDCADDGELVIFRIDKSAPEKTGAFSLNEIVRQVRTLFTGNADASDIFQSKLSAYGYIDLQEYSEQKYHCSGTQRYCVDNTFPRLTKKALPPQIVSLHYELSLPALTGWRKD